MTQLLPPALSGHPGFTRVFRPGHLSIGFIAPLEGYPDSPAPTLANHAAMARLADDVGIAALWLRDVPFFDPTFGDVGQILDPMVYAGWLSAVTRNIAIGTAGIVAPLRDPLIVAKQAASVDQLLGGRLLLGLSSGDRPAEYPAFGQTFNQRAARFREALQIIHTVSEQSFPSYRSQYHGNMDGNLDLIPKPAIQRFPFIAAGRAGQSLEWLAAHVDAWIWHGFDPRGMTDILPQWNDACAEHGYKPYGYGCWFDLDRNPDAPIQGGQVLRGGRHALIELWQAQQAAGVTHLVLNLKPTRRRPEDIFEELGRHILPLFPAHTATVRESAR
ncbi:TIGR03571 family LLM class oxidoreductase [Pseudomonas gingeri]|uniref:TIGR03571 family LLM class oxidoreductase n=1 Tax=Pseudomonas gingeri TaxID=117681 RepID=UPI0015A44D56|nr:TIGR03571 family LLM class oxidoreductase [Pseudomonas gingeri]NVZ24664.1 TIGR03571 family LLM class oxidoreductase [Pseudomonas gingeri]